jgi:hypothetical protein
VSSVPHKRRCNGKRPYCKKRKQAFATPLTSIC